LILKPLGYVPLLPSEFPRILFAGNSSGCIKRRPSEYLAAMR
jgi:hypothetical protein